MTAAPCNPSQLLEDLRRSPVEARASLLRGCGPLDATLTALIDHASGLNAADASMADDATGMVVNLADRIGSQLHRARARRARARALSYAGRFEDALAVAREGVRLAEEAGSGIDAGRAHLASMHALVELGRLDQAIGIGEAARNAFINAGEVTLAARADINLGIAHQRQDDPHRAVMCFDRAAPALAEEPLTLGILQNNRGEALVALNDFQGAHDAFQKALSASQLAGADLTSAIFEGNLADLAARQGHLHQALHYFERARRKLETNAAAGHLARLRTEQAEAMSVLGMPKEALHEYAAALPELDRCGLLLEAARARSGLGLTLLRLNRTTEAETALSAAARGFDELGHATALAKVDLIRAELAGSQGRTTDARKLALRAMAALQERPADCVVARLLLARLAADMNRLDEADAELTISLTLATELDLAPLVADVLQARGNVRQRQGRAVDAIKDFTSAVEQVERVRDSLQARRFRAAFLGGRTTVYESLMLSLLERGDADSLAQAFATAEKAKSRSLLEHIHNDTDDAAEPSDALDPTEAQLLGQAALLRGELNALYSRQADGHFSTLTWRDAVRKREAELENLEIRLASTDGVGRLYAPTAGLHETIRRLDAEVALIEFFIVRDRLVAMVLRDGKATGFRNLGRTSDIADHLARMRFQMHRVIRPGGMNAARSEKLEKDSQRELQALHDLVIGPLWPFLDGASTLTIVPHGLLHSLPFAALWNDGKYLVEQFAIRQVPCASLLARPVLPQVDVHVRPLVVGVADEDAPQIIQEAEQIASCLKCDRDCSLVGTNATVARVRQAAQQSSLIHLACHGRYVPGLPLGSGLRLGDRWLTVRDIYSWRLRARLVTLSGCETGLHRVAAGDELFGLLQAFLAAGARTVIASLWPVHDAYTKGIMSDFYRLLQGSPAHEPVSQLLRSVQLQMLHDSTTARHPALWAPFVAVGGE